MDGTNCQLGGRDLVQGVDHAIDHVFDQRAVVALRGHADDRLGARRSHDQAAMAVEPAFAIRDRRPHLGVLMRRAAEGDDRALVEDVVDGVVDALNSGRGRLTDSLFRPSFVLDALRELPYSRRRDTPPQRGAPIWKDRP